MFNKTYKGLINKIAGRLTSAQYAAYCSGLMTKDQLNTALSSMSLLGDIQSCSTNAMASAVSAIAQKKSSTACQAVAVKHLSKAGQGVKARIEKANAASKAVVSGTQNM